MVLSGFNDITIVDMDTIELSNLNRQFMFSQHDVGRYKVDAAAEFIRRKRPSVQITTKTGRIQSYSKKWICGFHMVMLCLDNDETRLWVNDVLVNHVKYKPTRAKFIDIISSTLQTQCTQQQQYDEQQHTFSVSIKGLRHPRIYGYITHPQCKDDRNDDIVVDLGCPNAEVVDINHPDLDPVRRRQLLLSIHRSLHDHNATPTAPLVQQQQREDHQRQEDEPQPILPFIIGEPTARIFDTMIPFVEGGTEGWRGQARLLLPTETYCLQCTRFASTKTDSQAMHDLHTHLCTIANIPRRPEHCIMYAHIILWPKLTRFTSRYDYDMDNDTSTVVKDISGKDGGDTHGGLTTETMSITTNTRQLAKALDHVELDMDNTEHIMWILDRAVYVISYHALIL